jgi:predicted DNA-binding protein
MARQLPLVETIKTTIRVPKDLHRRLKILAVKESRSYADLLIDAIELYLSTHERSENSPTGR